MDILDNKQLTPFFGSKKVKIGVLPYLPYGQAHFQAKIADITPI